MDAELLGKGVDFRTEYWMHHLESKDGWRCGETPDGVGVGHLQVVQAVE